jgi:hypothetical protein
MNDLYAVEMGVHQQENLWRMISILVVPCCTPDAAIRYVRASCPQAPRKSLIHRIYRVKDVAFDLPQGMCEIVEDIV